MLLPLALGLTIGFILGAYVALAAIASRRRASITRNGQTTREPIHDAMAAVIDDAISPPTDAVRIISPSSRATNSLKDFES